MKAGDKIYCKKDYDVSKFTLNKKPRIWFIKYKMYEVHITTNSNIYYLIDEEGDANDVVLNKYYDEYFYTEQEIRKLKIQKLNEYW